MGSYEGNFIVSLCFGFFLRKNVFIFKDDFVREYPCRIWLETDVDCFCDFPYFEEDAETLTCHDEPGCVFGLVEEILSLAAPGGEGTRKMIVCMTTLLIIVRNETPMLSCCKLCVNMAHLLRSPVGDI